MAISDTLDKYKFFDETRQDLLFKIKTTAGCRFNAAERLHRRDRSVNILSFVATAAVIFLSAAPALAKASEFVSTLFLIATLFASIMILVASLAQYAANDAVTAERMQQCALELSALRRQLALELPAERTILFNYSVKYDSILARFPNHQSVDYLKYRQEHPTEFEHTTRGGLEPSITTSEKASALLPVSATLAIVLVTIALVITSVSIQQFQNQKRKKLEASVFSSERVMQNEREQAIIKVCLSQAAANHADSDYIVSCAHHYGVNIGPAQGSNGLK